jgi:hypothetical protein
MAQRLSYMRLRLRSSRQMRSCSHSAAVAQKQETEATDAHRLKTLEKQHSTPLVAGAE